MIYLLALVALLAFAAGFLAGWVAPAEYQWRIERNILARVFRLRDEHDS